MPSASFSARTTPRAGPFVRPALCPQARPRPGTAAPASTAALMPRPYTWSPSFVHSPALSGGGNSPSGGSAGASKSRHFSLARSRDVRARRHLGLWLSNKFLRHRRARLFLRRASLLELLGFRVPRAALRLAASGWPGARVGPRVASLPGSKMDGSGDGGGRPGGARGGAARLSRGCWDGGGISRLPSAVGQGGWRRRGRGRPFP